ncbi:MAG: phage tail protein [Desulfobacterales bacterium]|nr:phage tail protein [Desulfobacterales bacterium]
MSLFWDYFRKTLRWGPIWNDGALSAIAKGGAFSLDEARDSILWLREQFVPEKCIEDYLPAHARSRAIGLRHYRETEAQYRVRVSKARVWHEKGGKAKGISEILEHYGFEDVIVFSLRTEDEARWAEFRLYVRPTFWMAAEDYDLLNEIANEFKAASAKLESIVVQFEAGCTSYVGVEILNVSHYVVECN